VTNEKLCAIIAEPGGDEFIPVLWENVRLLCFNLAGKYYRKNTKRAAKCGVELADVRQECYFAFLAALESYNREPRTVMFNSFLDFPIRNKVYSLIGIRNGRHSKKPLNNSFSLNAFSTDDESDSFINIIPDESAALPFEEIDYQSECDNIIKVVRNAVEKLEERQRDIIQLRFFEEKDLRSIGKRLNVSFERVRQLESKALDTLRQMDEIQAFRNNFRCNTGLSSFKRHGASSVELLAERRERLTKEYKQLAKSRALSMWQGMLSSDKRKVGDS
jgi:RNA polymerase sigma factor (sigma-70 family)